METTFEQYDFVANILPMSQSIYKEYYRIKKQLNGKVPTRMELMVHMEKQVYQYCMKHSKENPFCRYLEFLAGMNELSDDEKILYNSIGRHFISLIETTNMQKVYKMAILYAFYNHGNIRLKITDEEVLESWKEFFEIETYWKDFSEDMSLDGYRSITDEQHLKKAKTMPIKFLKSSGKGFFIEKDGYALAIREDLDEIITNSAFINHMRDVVEYRTKEYFRRRNIK